MAANNNRHSKGGRRIADKAALVLLFVFLYKEETVIKRFLFTSVFLLGLIVPVLAIKAQASGFALVAISPSGQKTVCVKGSENSVMSALQNQGFNPKQDDTGFIYSLIGYDGPPSSDPAAQQNFWGFWISDDLSFSTLGPGQIKPQNDELYLFHFGNGTKPATSTKYADICVEAPAPTPAPINPSAEQPTGTPTESQQVGTNQSNLFTSFQYLRNNSTNQGSSAKDWAAMALGSHNQSIEVSSNDSESVLSLSRIALSRAAQGLDRTTQVNKIKDSYRENQLGNPDLINDDIFGILAIQSTDPGWLKDHQPVFDTILSSQRSDGSFGFSKSSDGDVDITAATIWALVYKQASPTASLNKASAYIAGAHNSDGGFGFKPNQMSNVASTSWAILAYRSIDKSVTQAENYLINNEQSGGYWLIGSEPNYLNTAYAVLALSGKKMPVVANPPTNPIPTPPSTIKPKPRKIIETTWVITELEETASTESHSSSGSCSASASASASASGGNASATASASASCN
ncbi:MAG: terpene cyclase/mutase family protein [bacterium]|nr:terpene cyclase/mutase family protein [bacterium]